MNVLILFFFAFLAGPQVHISAEFLEWLRETYPFVRLNMIPPGCTSKVQIADIVLNRPFKVRMKACFNKHVTDDVLRQLRGGVPSNCVMHDLALSVLKPLSVDWMMDAHAHMKSLAPVVLEAYSKTGILKAWDAEFQVSVLFCSFVIYITSLFMAY